MRKIISFLLLLLFTFSLANAFTTGDFDQADFDSGTYNQTVYNTTEGVMRLNVSHDNGSFISQVFDATSSTNWTSISWEKNKTDIPVQAYSHWHMNEDTGTNITDSSGNNRWGELVNAGGGTWQSSCKLNACLYFDGSVQYVNMSNTSFNFERTDAFSVDMWIKTNQVTGFGSLFGKVNMDDTRRGYALGIMNDGEDLSFILTSDKDTNDLIQVKTTLASQINDNDWHHVVVTYDGSSTADGVDIWVDNNNETLTVIYDSLASTIQTEKDLQISGRDYDWNMYNGMIDEMVVYDYVLSEENISERWNGGDGTETLPPLYEVDYNISARSCDDAVCSGESWSEVNTTTDFYYLNLTENRYFQYMINMTRLNSSAYLGFYNVSIEYATAPNITVTNPAVNPDPVIIGNPANWSVECGIEGEANITYAKVYINKTGNVSSYSLSEDEPGNWSALLTQGGLNGTTWTYWFRCGSGAVYNDSSKYNTSIILPNITMRFYLQPNIQINEYVVIPFQVFSDDGYNVDARWAFLWINYTNGTQSNTWIFWTTANRTYPTIDSFDDQLDSNWAVIAPNETGSYTFYYQLGDNWGNVWTSETQTVTPSTEAEGAIPLFFIFGFLLFTVIAITSKGGDAWLQTPSLFLACIFMVLTLLQFTTIADDYSLENGIFIGWIQGITALISLIVGYFLISTLVRAGRRMLGYGKTEY